MNFNKNSVWANILLMIIISVVLVIIGLVGLNLYTRHGQTTRVPDIAGMQFDEAKQVLKKAHLRAQIVDSVFNKEAKPGAILDISPKAGTVVKPGRYVYITINPLMPPTQAIPNVVDMSARQALALLHSMGFEHVKQKIVPGDFSDLAKGLQDARGQKLMPGTRVPLQSIIYLLVVGYIPPDSLQMGETDRATDSTYQAQNTQDTTVHTADDESWW